MELKLSAVTGQGNRREKMQSLHGAPRGQGLDRLP